MLWFTVKEKREFKRMLYKACFVGWASSLVCVGTCLNSKVLEHNKAVAIYLNDQENDWFWGGADG